MDTSVPLRTKQRTKGSGVIIIFTMLRPNRLRDGDKVAIVSPSWGGPALFPHVLDFGIRVLRERFHLDVTEMPSTGSRRTRRRGQPT
jgi:hypothetical protein